jgi:hypothetical protein
MATVAAKAVAINTKMEENELLNRIPIRLTLFSSSVGRFSMHSSNGCPA